MNDNHHFNLPSHQEDNRYKLSREQAEVYKWLKQQGLNTDDATLSYWSKIYPPKRIIEVVQFAQQRCQTGQTILNIGGWVHKLLKTGLAVVNDGCKNNLRIAQEFKRTHEWKDLNIFEKYVKDIVTDDDLPLTMPTKDFMRSLEALYRKSRLYKDM